MANQDYLTDIGVIDAETAVTPQDAREGRTNLTRAIERRREIDGRRVSRGTGAGVRAKGVREKVARGGGQNRRGRGGGEGG